VEVVEEEKTREERSREKEWVWNPVVKITVMGRRRVVGHNRRSMLVEMLVNICRLTGKSFILKRGRIIEIVFHPL
jgi:hypothetical protein